MADEPTTAGTPVQEGTDAGVSPPTSGTPEPEDRDAAAGSDPLSLQWKANLEAERRRNQELAEENARLKSQGQSPAAPVAEDRRERIRVLEQQAKEFADKGDPVAALQLEDRAERLQFQQDTIDFAQLSQIEDKTERQAVFEHYQKNPGMFRNVNEARANLALPRLQTENQRLREENERLKKGPDPSVVRAPSTLGREAGIGPRESSKMTTAEFDKRVAQIRSEQGDSAARAYQRKLRNNEIVLTD